MNFIVKSKEMKPVIVNAQDIKEAYDIFVSYFFDEEEEPSFIAEQILSVELLNYEILNGNEL